MLGLLFPTFHYILSFFYFNVVTSFKVFIQMSDNISLTFLMLDYPYSKYTTCCHTYMHTFAAHSVHPCPKHFIPQALRRYVTSLSRHSQPVKAANPTEHFSPVQFKPLSKEILHKDRLGVIGRNLVISSSWSLGENKSYLHQSRLGLNNLFRDNTNFIQGNILYQFNTLLKSRDLNSTFFFYLSCHFICKHTLTHTNSHINDDCYAWMIN